MKLSIIFPAYNEENRILPVLKKFQTYFNKKLKNNFEMIIIPNNCSDNTSSIVKKFCSKNNDAKFFEIKNYSGKGGAVMKGFALAKGNFIGFVDSDKSTSPKEFFKLYSNIANYDGIIGSRKIKGAKVIPKRSIGKKINSLLFGIFVKLLFNLKYKDTQCGAKIFKKKIAKEFTKNLIETGWIFDINLLKICKDKNYEVLEFPINWKDDDGSHISFIDGIKSIFYIFKLRFTS